MVVVGFELSYENIEEIRFCTPFCTPGRPLIPPFSVPYRLNFQPIDVPGGKVLHFAGAGLDLHSGGLMGARPAAPALEGFHAREGAAAHGVPLCSQWGANQFGRCHASTVCNWLLVPKPYGGGCGVSLRQQMPFSVRTSLRTWAFRTAPELRFSEVLV